MIKITIAPDNGEATTHETESYVAFIDRDGGCLSNASINGLSTEGLFGMVYAMSDIAKRLLSEVPDGQQLYEVYAASRAYKESKA
ncbi:MAG: hypothetical protein EOM66_01205 [Clostridia bacterium]|nr:hypothetical protein [Clostridia bacterium]